jgi:hypothetical protein
VRAVVRTCGPVGPPETECRDGSQGPAHVLEAVWSADGGEIGRPARAAGSSVIGSSLSAKGRCDQFFSSTLSGEDREPEGEPCKRVVAGDRLIFEGFDPGSE